jgi:hypothetical protein
VALELERSHASVNRYVVMARRELMNVLLAYTARCSPELDAWPTGDGVQEGEVVGSVGKVVEGRGEAAARWCEVERRRFGCATPRREVER